MLTCGFKSIRRMEENPLDDMHILNQVFVLNVVCSNFLGFGGGRKRGPVEARNGFTSQHLENCNSVVITYVIPQNLHCVSL